MITGSDNLLIFACLICLFNLGSLHSSTYFPLPFTGAFDPFCVHAPVRSDISPSLSNSSPSDTLSVSLPFFLSHNY